MQVNWHYLGKGKSPGRLKNPFPSPPAYLVFFLSAVVIVCSGSERAPVNQFHKHGVSHAPLFLKGGIFRRKMGGCDGT